MRTREEITPKVGVAHDSSAMDSPAIDSSAIVAGVAVLACRGA